MDARQDAEEGSQGGRPRHRKKNHLKGDSFKALLNQLNLDPHHAEDAQRIGTLPAKEKAKATQMQRLTRSDYFVARPYWYKANRPRWYQGALDDGSPKQARTIVGPALAGCGGFLGL